jgi:hypothetical protein
VPAFLVFLLVPRTPLTLPFYEMTHFSAAFDIIDERGCPFYNIDDRMVLSDKAVFLPVGRPSCLILVRAVTELLFQLLPAATVDFAEYRETVFTCGGCTGLIKFKLGNLPEGLADDDGEPVITGRIDAILPAELLQIFHMHQKTGKLLLDMESGTARVTFREGAVIAARFEELDNQEAIYAMLSERKGYFRFVPGLPASMMKSREIGDFMMILMEGLRRMDEGD